MGVNLAGSCIVDDAAVCAAARQEIVRRHYAVCATGARAAVGTRRCTNWSC
ncbi:MAG: DUF1846 domain-containing protein [Intestinimonas sp.]